MNYLDKYAELVVKFGVNIQKGQPLIVRGTTETCEFVRLVTKHAYKQGASEVVIVWTDEYITRLKMEFASEEVLETSNEWQKVMYKEYADKGACLLSILAMDPDLLNGIDPKRVNKATRSMMESMKEIRDLMMSDQLVWCVASVPTLAWSKKVFPGVSGEEALEKLWEAIYKTVRIDTDDPVNAWMEHEKNLEKRKKILNDYHFEKMIYTNSIGTNFEVKLAEKHIWQGGSHASESGTVFFANMPTEEVFTMPDRNSGNGRLVSSLPLNYQGNLIEDFWFEFEDGKIVDYGAKAGLDVLKNLLEFDEGAKYLGEIALVDYDSPISNQNILFYNTLFDENASCHFAVGNAYPGTIDGGKKMSKDQLSSEGANASMTHVDFMVGSKDLSIIGVTKDKKKVTVFKDGNLVL